MDKRLIPLMLAAIGTSAFAADSVSQNYYDYEAPIVRAPHSQSVESSPSRRKAFVVDSDSIPANAGPRQAVRAGQDEPNQQVSGHMTQPALPPNMDRGVRDLEAGMDDLRSYTSVMAAHVQQNGMRGFLAIPQEIKDQGQAVGRKIGGGIGGIMTDAAHEMIVPEKH